jgi:hypothetical protein
MMRETLAATVERLRGGRSDRAEGEERRDLRDRVADPTRREALAGIATAGGLLGGFKALDNVVLGYGVLVGTNLVAQDLAPLLTERLTLNDHAFALADGRTLRVRDGRLLLAADTGRIDALDLESASAGEAAAFDDRHGLRGGPAAELHADHGAVAAGEVSFAFDDVEGFFDRVADAPTRPFTAGTLRGRFHDDTDAAVVADFADVDPGDPEALVGGLADGFRQHTDYDVPRYAAGSVQDNVIMGAHDLRQYFRSPVDFDAIRDGGHNGLFCYEFTRRAMDAFHAVAPHRQTVPVVAGAVHDSRHKHVYNVLAAPVREDGDLVLATTFLDYTHVTLYDDLHAQALLGSGLDAYNRRHRATNVYWA